MVKCFFLMLMISPFERILASFPREQIKIYLFELLKKDAAEMISIFEAPFFLLGYRDDSSKIIPIY